MLRQAWIPLTVLLIAAGPIGCGDSGRAVTTDTVTMTEYSFSPKHVVVDRGATLTVRNEGEIAHNLAITRGTDPLAKPQKLTTTDTFLGGRSERLKVDLPPGRYLMVSTVPGQRQLGMYGTLTVR